MHVETTASEASHPAQQPVSSGLPTSDPQEADLALDYAMSPADAMLVMGLLAMPAVDRRATLERLVAPAHALELFAQFIGLANSVASNAREQAVALLIAEGGMHPHQAEKLNMPNLPGALAGISLARGIDPEPLCHGCAFRQGSIANQCWPTVCDADGCSRPEEVPFLCHEVSDPAQPPATACQGFIQARAQANAAARRVPE